jgi:hypothetical protein
MPGGRQPGSAYVDDPPALNSSITGSYRRPAPSQQTLQLVRRGHRGTAARLLDGPSSGDVGILLVGYVKIR